MQKPLKDYKVTCKYGVSRKVACTNGKTITDIHSGIDLVSNYDDILAYGYGKVIYTTEDDGTGAKTVVTAHHHVLPYGFVLLCLYTHLDKILVSKDDVVTESTVLGKQGSTGNVSGKHLHVSCYAIPPLTWKTKKGKYYSWDYKTRENYEINPNDIFHFYEG